MSEIPADNIMSYFCDLEDPRSGQNISHFLLNIITIAILGMICVPIAGLILNAMVKRSATG